jgi:hypothetical protein
MSRACDQQKQNHDAARNHDGESKMHFARRAVECVNNLTFVERVLHVVDANRRTIR